jgi:YHS domain-containing protein
LKNTIVILLALAIFAAAGCGNKTENNEPAKQETKQLGELKKIASVDPVDGTEIKDIGESKYSYVYNDIEYHFNSKENYEAFKKDPEKYLSE